MFDRIKNYVVDNEFHFQYFNQRINIVNYIEILVLEENRISLKHSRGILVVHGKKLRIQKLLDQEILIVGEIQSIELG